MASFQYRKLFKKRTNYSKLFNEEDKARMTYNKDVRFRQFVAEWNIDDPTTLGYTILDFYRIYSGQSVQLTLALA